MCAGYSVATTKKAQPRVYFLKSKLPDEKDNW